MRRVRRDPAEWASIATALLMTGALWTVAVSIASQNWRDLASVPPPVERQTLEVSLEPAPATTPAPPAAPTPPPPVPRKVVLKNVPHPTASAPAPVAAASQETVNPDPVPEGGAVVAAAAAAPGAESAGTSHADLDAQYAAGLRADIDRRTRPPDSAQYRLRRPSGEVRVGFMVLRDGTTRSVRVLRSSGSVLLDEAAVGIVASGHYPPMPPKAFFGENEHPFVVTIEFRPGT